MADFTNILSQLDSLKGRVDASLHTVVDDIVTAVKAVQAELQESSNKAQQANAPDPTTKAESHTTPKGSTATSTHSPVERH